jgi:hypothetical protein
MFFRIGKNIENVSDLKRRKQETGPSQPNVLELS